MSKVNINLSCLDTGAMMFEGFFPCSLIGTITHVVGGNLITMWLQIVVMIIIWKFP
jgi:hypothetical protein